MAITARLMGEYRLLADKPLGRWHAAALLKLMWEAWNDVFRRPLGHAERTRVSGGAATTTRSRAARDRARESSALPTRAALLRSRQELRPERPPILPQRRGVPMLGDLPVLDAEHVEPRHEIDACGIVGVAHLAHGRHGDDVPVG